MSPLRDIVSSTTRFRKSNNGVCREQSGRQMEASSPTGVEGDSAGGVLAGAKWLAPRCSEEGKNERRILNIGLVAFDRRASSR